MAKIKHVARPRGPLTAEATEQIARLIQSGLVEIRGLLQAGKQKQAEQLAAALHNLPEVLIDVPYYDIAEDVRQGLLSYQLTCANDRNHQTDYATELVMALGR